MKRIARFSLGLLLVAFAPVNADHIEGYEERPMTLREARAAIAVVEGAGLRGWLKASVGGETIGIPPSPGALREICFEVVQREPVLIEKGCASGDAFIDDFFTIGEASGSFDTVVTNAFGQKVSESRVTLAATWTRSFENCTFPHDPGINAAHPLVYRTQAGAPVTIYAETELLIACLAEEVSLSMSSQYFNELLDIEEIPGTPQGIMGLYAGEFWHHPEECIPWPDDLCLPEA